MIGNFNTLDVQGAARDRPLNGDGFWHLVSALLLIGVSRHSTFGNGYYCLDAVFRLAACCWPPGLKSFKQSWLGTGQVSSTTWWRQYSLE